MLEREPYNVSQHSLISSGINSMHRSSSDIFRTVKQKKKPSLLVIKSVLNDDYLDQKSSNMASHRNLTTDNSLIALKKVDKIQ